MKKTKIPLSRKGRKVKKIIYMVVLITIVLSLDNKQNEVVIFQTNYSNNIATLNSYNYKKTPKTPPKEVVKVVVNSKGSKIASYAKQFVGNPYVKGGTSLTKGADCSGFTQSIYKYFGMSLPRTVLAQSKVGTKASFSSLQPGDLVFYSNGGSTPTHVAIYIGNGKIIHASTPSGGIKISMVNIMTKVTARRIKM